MHYLSLLFEIIFFIVELFGSKAYNQLNSFKFYRIALLPPVNNNVYRSKAFTKIFTIHRIKFNLK